MTDRPPHRRIHLSRLSQEVGPPLTSTFSQQAVEFAKHLSRRVVLIDDQRLADLMIEHDIGVRVSRAIQFKRIDEDFFAEED
jgi:restriction system protein